MEKINEEDTKKKINEEGKKKTNQEEEEEYAQALSDTSHAPSHCCTEHHRITKHRE